MASDELVAWLRAEIEADRRDAGVKVIRGHWKIDPDQWIAGTGIVSEQGRPVAVGIGDYAARHIVRHDPLDVLADCEAKLRMLDLHGPVEGVGGGIECEACGPNNASPPGTIAVLGEDDPFWPCATVLVLASGYRHREGYKGEWRP